MVRELVAGLKEGANNTRSYLDPILPVVDLHAALDFVHFLKTGQNNRPWSPTFEVGAAVRQIIWSTTGVHYIVGNFLMPHNLVRIGHHNTRGIFFWLARNALDDARLFSAREVSCGPRPSFQTRWIVSRTTRIAPHLGSWNSVTILDAPLKWHYIVVKNLCT